jgi:hypothetical protein
VGLAPDHGASRAPSLALRRRHAGRRGRGPRATGACRARARWRRAERHGGVLVRDAAGCVSAGPAASTIAPT